MRIPKKNDVIERVHDLNVSSPSTVVSSAEKLTVIGNAWDVYAGDFSLLAMKSDLSISKLTYPSAAALLSLAEQKYRKQDWVDAAVFSPVYVRNNVAKKSSKKLPGRREEAGS